MIIFWGEDDNQVILGVAYVQTKPNGTYQTVYKSPVIFVN
jgi:hypothetical protein